METVFRFRRQRVQHAARTVFFSFLLVAATELPAVAYNCSGKPWQPIYVTPASNVTGVVTGYTIDTTVPSLDGCDITTSSQITIAFPADTNAGSVTGGTVNLTPISTILSQSGQTLVFVSPVPVNNNAALSIVLNGVTNPTSPGSMTLSMSANPVLNGSIANTVSTAYVLLQATPTNTVTATLSPTRTSTPTVTPTVPTPTPTPTITLTPLPALCSDGLGVNPCVAGGGPVKTDCVMEWWTSPAPKFDAKGKPKSVLICYEGDPRCDVDPVLDNHSCTVRTRICLNNHDPRLPKCIPSDVRTFEVKSPNPKRPKDPADQANLATLESQAGPLGLGLTVVRGVTVMSPGATNAAADVCTNEMSLHIPLKVSLNSTASKQTRRFRVVGRSSLAVTDTDTLKIQCRPSTCGDHIVQRDHETCDDGNRINGDGCDQGCQTEN